MTTNVTTAETRKAPDLMFTNMVRGTALHVYIKRVLYCHNDSLYMYYDISIVYIPAKVRQLGTGGQVIQCACT